MFRKPSKELPFISGDSDFKRGEEKRCPPDQTPATHKRRAERKSNTQKPEVTTSPKLPQPELLQLQHHANIPHKVVKLIPSLYNLELAQHKGWTLPLSKTVEPSKAILHNPSSSRKTLQTSVIFQVSRLICINTLSKCGKEQKTLEKDQDKCSERAAERLATLLTLKCDFSHSLLITCSS
ncbi:hypothetical protein ACTXT7_010103 [Hymenolepis weldensis]